MGSGEAPKNWTDHYHFHSSGFCAGENQLEFQIEHRKYACKSLRKHMKDLGDTYIDILKMDVEMMEWAWIKQEDFSSLKIGQILVEFHFNFPGAGNFVNFL